MLLKLGFRMRPFVMYVFCCVFLSSCNSKDSKKDVIIKKVTSEYSEIVNEKDYTVLTDSIVTKSRVGVPQLCYKFNRDTSGIVLKSIIIYSDRKKIQEIKTSKLILNREYRLVDWNFDGHKDISVLYNCGSGGCAYWIWNYSPKSKKYYYNKTLSEVLGLEIDTTLKNIIFHNRMGFSEEVWDTMQYKNDKLTFIKGTYQQRWPDTIGNVWIKLTRTKIVKHKPVITVDSAIVEQLKRSRKSVLN